MDQQEVNLSPVKSPFFCSGRNVQAKQLDWLDFIQIKIKITTALYCFQRNGKRENNPKRVGKIQGKGVGYAKGGY